MVTWKDENGNPYTDPEIISIIDESVSSLSERDKIRYEEIIQEIGELFKGFNKKYCPNCESSVWSGPVRSGEHKGKLNDRGCCICCGGAKGYLGENNEDIFLSDLVKHKFKYFSTKNGFFDTCKMRCSLPRQLRSITCLKYACKRDVYRKADDIVDGLRLLRWNNMMKMKEIYDRIAY